jgi:GTP-binding protein EngB required for normal cell division
MDLRAYEQYKFELAEVIRSGMLAAGKDHDSEAGWRALLARLAEDRFTVVVAGRFNRGKSSLMNAVLGLDRLPTGIVPLTSVITYVRYGTDERVLLDYLGSGLRGEAKLEDLPEYVTEKGNPGNRKRIRSAEIQVPAEILRRGFFFVDTPGLGSAIFENTQTTESFIPEIDLLLLVTSYESPLSEDEVRFLQQAAPAVRRLFVVINKQDTVPPSVRQEVVEYVEKTARAVLGQSVPKIYSVSAKDGLAAKLTDNQEALQESGIQELEAELIRFLAEEKAQVFLSAMCNRVRDQIQSLPERDAERLSAALESLSQRIEPGQVHRSDDQRRAEALILSAVGLNHLGTCEVCQAVWQAQFKFLSKYQYELSVRPKVQEEHAANGGFCPLHTWHYEQITSPRGVCTAYPALLNQVAARLRSFATDGCERLDSCRPLLSPHCPVCEVRRESESRIIDSILSRVAVSSPEQSSLSALCLPHLQLLLEHTEISSVREYLLLREASLLERTAEDMQRYAIKHDALRRGLTTKEEQTAPLRALQILVGHKNVNAIFTVRDIL